MSSALDSLKAAVAIAFATTFQAATLIRTTGRASDGRGGWTNTTASVACRALVTEFNADQRATAGIPSSEKRILILGGSLSQVPVAGDRIDVQGGVWRIVSLQRDPAAATYECRAMPLADAADTESALTGILAGVADAIHGGMAPIFDVGTLYTVTDRASDGRGGWLRDWADQPCRALVMDYSASLRGLAGIPDTERRVMILAASIDAEPRVGDVVSVEGAKWEFIEIARDPANATFDCRSRPTTEPDEEAFYIYSLNFLFARNSMYYGQVV